ncbi:MAG TPA: RNA polymerase sigma factor [Pirellulales bacterium]|nr:RNA polymerase sigma factor [Pirellulales bacterium]
MAKRGVRAAGLHKKNVLASEPFGWNRGITGIVSIPEDDERELIDRARGGEATAFERLAEQYAARLWRCALALCKDKHWAEDLVQETLIGAWQSVARFDGRCVFSSWLHGILRHRFLKGRRQQNAARLSASDGLDQTPCIAHTPDRSAEASEDALRIRRTVAKLPEEHRLVVELRFFAGATLDEIAAVLGCPLGTVKSRLHHALKKLRQMNPTVNLFTSDRE